MKKQISISRLIQDIEEGIIVVDNDGTISNVNPKAINILSINNDIVGEKYVSLINKDKNDEFHQLLIDAVVDKNVVHKKRIKYKANNELKTIYIASSILKDDNDNQIGIILSFDDVTKEERLKAKNRDSAIIFIILVTLLALWMFACAIFINDKDPISSVLFGRFIMYLPLVFTPIATKVCGFKIDDLGLRITGIKKYVKIDFILTMVSVLIMIAIKLIIMRFIPTFYFYNPPGVFFDFNKYSLWQRVEYAICVVAQEYLSRGLVYECVRRMVLTEKTKKYVDYIAILVSSLYFAALHIYLGVGYMIGAFILLSIFGIIYKKQKSIWGLCIPHFVLGCMIEILGFTAS